MRSRPVPAVLILLAALAAEGCRSPEAVTFGVIADCQFAAVPASGSRFYDRSWLKLREALDGFNARGVRFVVHLGDLIDRDSASYDLILPVFRNLRAPVRFVLGNHDYDIAEADRPGLLERLGIGPGYYAFTEENWRFVVLNGDELAFNSPKDAGLEQEAAAMYAGLLAAKRPHATKWNGGIGRAQMAFLEDELATADRKGLSVVILCHFPVHPPAAHNLWNDGEVVARLESHPSVKAYFAGHNHDGGLAVKNGIVYLTFAGIVETPDTSASAVVTLAEDRLLVDGSGREPDRILALR